MLDVSITISFVLDDEMVEIEQKTENVIDDDLMVDVHEIDDKLLFDIHVQIVYEIQMFHDELVDSQVIVDEVHELIDAHDGKQ